MNKSGRYDRLYEQIKELIPKGEHSISAMATISAVLFNKMDSFFWCGFYFLHEGKLKLGPYQGSLACQILEKDKGVCWAAINNNEAIVVPDTDKFPGHITCDSRSKSEIVIPIKDKKGKCIAVLDVDSDQLNTFEQVDLDNLSRIISLIEPLRL